MIGRILRLPFYLISIPGILAFPALLIAQIFGVQGSEEMIIVISGLAVGLTISIFSLTLIHAAIIEHYLIANFPSGRGAQKVAERIVWGGDGWSHTMGAHVLLEKLLDEKSGELSEVVLLNTQEYIRRHRAIVKVLAAVVITTIILAAFSETYR